MPKQTTTDDACKRCDCDEAKWPKCAHPWYLPKFRYGGKSYAPNLTRYAIDVLGRDALDTKTEADALADAVRVAIRAGTYLSAKTKKNTIAALTDEAERVLMAAAIAEFGDAVIDADADKRKQQKARDRSCLATLAAFKTKRGLIGALPVDAVTADDLVAFRRSDAIAPLANSSWAKYRTVLGQFFTWAKSKSKRYTKETPFEALSPHEKKALKRGRSTPRRRRISESEEAALLRMAGRSHLDAAAERLQAIIVAAIETAMRLGELLALQWGDVDLTNRAIYVRAEEEGASKTARSRMVPMSDTLFELLTAMITDPNGERFGRRAYVFGDAVGGRVTKIRKAWITCVLRAHNHTPTWKRTALAPVSAAKLREIDLHFHDLRHEGASRWLESGVWTLEEIRQALGHATIAQTATYLHCDGDSPKRAMQRYNEQRKQQAKTAAVAAAAAPKPSRDVHKLSTNGPHDDQHVSGPRLVKSDKS